MDMAIEYAESLSDFINKTGWSARHVISVVKSASETHRRYVALIVAEDGSEHLFHYTNKNRLYNKCKILGIDNVKSILVYERR